MNNDIIKAIADKTRLSLLLKIAEKEICACDLPRFVRTSQPTVSQHLKVLLACKLVGMRKDGVKRLYSVSDKGKSVLQDISRW